MQQHTPFARTSSSPSDAAQAPATPRFLGSSAAASRVRAEVTRALRTRAPVLLVGGPGTGKKTVARMLHHFEGAGAGELRVVEAGPHTRLARFDGFAYVAGLENLAWSEQVRIPHLAGSGRVVLGTCVNPDSLHPELAAWTSSARIVLPSLSERVEDLEVLAIDVLGRLPAARPIGGISGAALNSLRAHDWPGGVRELTRVLADAVGKGVGEQVELRDLPPALQLRINRSEAKELPEHQLRLKAAEREAIERAMRYTKGHKREAARILDIGKTTLYRKLKEYGIG